MKLGCKAACMTAGVSPAAVDGMSTALGINLLAGQKVISDTRVDLRYTGDMGRLGARKREREGDKQKQAMDLVGVCLACTILPAIGDSSIACVSQQIFIPPLGCSCREGGRGWCIQVNSSQSFQKRAP